LSELFWFECQKCGFKGNSTDFTTIEETENDYDVDFSCPKCKSANVKKRFRIMTNEEYTIWKHSQVVRGG
jgi:predicted RNA-binding Zn-ribbon protein involved in translation (DUF1610 family)